MVMIPVVRASRISLFTIMFAVVVASLYYLQYASAFSLSEKPVSSLIREHSLAISSLKDLARTISSDAPDDDVFYLRYCLTDLEDDDRKERLESNMRWRAGEGRTICENAKSAIAKATAAGMGTWKNDHVREAAPSASTINKYITPSNIITTTTSTGDLIYCLKPSTIDVKSLMKEISVADMTDFFLYTKEVNAAVANSRSLENDRLVCVLNANDLSGIQLIGGDTNFQKSLSLASKKANELYPVLAGPSLILNLPRLLGALVKLFLPLFPAEVRERIKFARGPLKEVVELNEVLAGGDGDARKRKDFLAELDELVY